MKFEGRFFFFLIVVLLVVSCDQEKGEYFEHSTSPFSDKIKIEYTVSEPKRNTEGFVDVSKRTSIDPSKTALVIIDLWRLNYLDSVVVNYINPLVNEMDSLGIKIVYSPSGGPQHRSLDLLENGVHFYKLDMMDKFVSDYEIENLIYIGFDTMYCVLDKPNGIYSFLERNGTEVNVFVMENGMRSSTEEMKLVALELLKKNNVGVIKNKKELEVRFPKKTKTNVFELTEEEVQKGNSFMVFFEKEEVDVDFQNFKMRVAGMNIPFAVVRDGEMFFEDKALSPFDFLKLHHKLNIDNLYYAGYYLNNEIMWSDYGLISMYIKKRYFEIDIPQRFLVNDLCYINPSDTILPEIEKYTITNHYRGVKNILSATFLKQIEEDARREGPILN